LCLGVVVVEAAERSGSLITARTALEQDRQVFAVPGSPLSGKTRGSNRLLREGARIVECVEDVLEELLPQINEAVHNPQAVGKLLAQQAKPQRILTDSEPTEVKAVLQCFKSADKLHVDSIIESSRLTASTVLRLLLELELRGLVTQHPGKLFSLSQP